MPPFAFDSRRWDLVDRVVAGASLVLFVMLFLPWFTASIFFTSFSGSGLDAHGYLYIPLIISIALVIYLVLRAGMDPMPFKVPMEHAVVLLIATAINFVLVLIGFIATPGGPVNWSRDFGAYIALLAAIVAVALPVRDFMQARSTAGGGRRR
ncbi:MAG: hypothetical protein ACRDZT_06390 [Acidimicrobiales bacterium]